MSPELVRQCLNARPFKPFTLALADHSEVRVDDAAAAELTADGSALQFVRRDERILVALHQIVTITIESRQGGAFGFGSRRPSQT
jgi:hypothetical protein